MANTISKYDDIIDSRDIIARIEELDEALSDGKAENEAFELEQEDAEELKALRAVASECEGYGDWSYGEALIRYSYFETYAEELADDIGAIDSNAKWPLNHIDWEAAARELQQDYTEVDFDGVAYFMRS